MNLHSHFRPFSCRSARTRDGRRPAALFVLALFLLPLRALAGGEQSLQQARQYYDSRQYAAAETAYKQAISQGASDANTYYHLGLAQLHQGEAEALISFGKAKQIDPGFASHSKIDEMIAKAQALGSGTPLPAGNGSSAGGVEQTLRSSDLYVDPALTVEPAERTDLEDSVGRQGGRVKVALLSRRPQPNAMVYAHRLYNQVSSGNGAVIVVAPGTVGAYSKSLSGARLKDLQAQALPTLRGSLALGAAALTRSIGLALGGAGSATPAPTTGAVPASSTSGTPMQSTTPSYTTDIVIILVIVGLVFWILHSRRKGQKNRMAQVAELGGRIGERIRRIDESLPFLPDSPGKHEAEDLRHQAGRAFGEGMNLSQSGSDLDRASYLFNQADALLDRAQSRMNHPNDPSPAPPRPQPQPAATGGPTLVQPAGDPARGVPITLGSTPGQGAYGQSAGYNAAPQGAAATGSACFFCSRPSTVTPLQPVVINIGGRQQQVLACPEDAARAGQGQAQVLGVPYNGQMMPWWSVPSYNPYSNWNQPVMGSGWMPFGAGLVGGMLLEDLLFDQRPHYSGWAYGDWGPGWGYSDPYWEEERMRSANQAYLQSDQVRDYPADTGVRDDYNTGGGGAQTDFGSDQS